jgi:hypothetical protein
MAKSYIVHFNLLWLCSEEYYQAVCPIFDRFSDIKLIHDRYHHLGGLLEHLFEQSTDLMVLEKEYLNHATEAVLELLPQYDAALVLLAEAPKNVFFAFRMNVDFCYQKALKANDIRQLIAKVLEQKNTPGLPLEAFEQNVILPLQDHKGLKVLPWKQLISIHQSYKETQVYLTDKSSFAHPMPYQLIKKYPLTQPLFFELKPGCTININHLESITFKGSNDYHCLLSDGRMIEINSGERTALLRFIETKTRGYRQAK